MGAHAIRIPTGSSAIAVLAFFLTMPFELAEAADPAKAARCHELYGLMYRYVDESVTHHNSGARFRSDVAEALCAAGDYDRGIAELETELTRANIPIPPPK